MSTQTNTFKVDDMHCDSCPRLIQLELKDKPGVASVTANLDTKLVTIEFDPQVISTSELSKSITDSGYTPKLLQL